MSNSIEFREVQANGFTFRCRTCGMDQQGELIVFLHGYPETSITWEPAMQALAAKGYRCFAPNQRGYSPGARPKGVENYTQRKLASDVIAMVDAIGGDKKFHLVGHDWGANMGWVICTLYPERLQTYTAFSTPHTKDYISVVLNDPKQRQMSQYIFNYLEDDKPEDYLAENDFAKLRNAYKGFPQRTIDEYIALFSDREARTATINWYRAKYRQAVGQAFYDEPIAFDDIFLPVLFMWGNQDAYTSRAGVEASHKNMKGYYKFVEIDGGHWLMEFNADQCVKELTEHIQKFPIQ